LQRCPEDNALGKVVTNDGRLFPFKHEVFSPRIVALEMNSAVMLLMHLEK
jgi:hypothetical protein